VRPSGDNDDRAGAAADPERRRARGRDQAIVREQLAIKTIVDRIAAVEALDWGDAVRELKRTNPDNTRLGEAWNASTAAMVMHGLCVKALRGEA
jgi:hypothetical protein